MPEGPAGITFLFGEIPQMISLNAAFHDNVVDARLLKDALEMAARDPIALMTHTASAPDGDRGCRR
jgi:hypothetical protein